MNDELRTHRPGSRHRGFYDARLTAHLAENHRINDPRSRQALQKLERLRACPERTRMPGLLLHGESIIGKSLVTQKF